MTFQAAKTIRKLSLFPYFREIKSNFSTFLQTNPNLHRQPASQPLRSPSIIRCSLSHGCLVPSKLFLHPIKTSFQTYTFFARVPQLRCSLPNESTRRKESTKREEKKEQVELEWKKEGILYGGSMECWNALKIYTRA